MDKNDLRSIHFAAVAIGASELATYLGITLPSMLSPNNLPGLAGRQHTFHLYTSRDGAAAAALSPAFRRLQSLLVTEAHVVEDWRPDLIELEPDDVLECCFSHAARLAGSDDGPMAPVWPGAIFPDGSIKRLERLAAESRQHVAAFIHRVSAARVVPYLASHFTTADGSVLTIGSRDLVRLALDHPSPASAQHRVDSPFFPNPSPTAVWRVGHEGLLVRSIVLHPVLAFPLKKGRLPFRVGAGLGGPAGAVEWRVRPETSVRVVEDSDEFCVASVDAATGPGGVLLHGSGPDFASMASRISETHSTRVLAFLRRRLCFRATEPTEAWTSVQEEADGAVRVIACQVETDASQSGASGRIAAAHPYSHQMTADYLVPRVNRLVAGWLRRGKRVVVYAAASHTQVLASTTDLFRANIVGIADFNPLVQGRVVLGRTVVSPDAILGLRPDVVLISSGIFQDDIYEQIAELERHGMELVRLYRRPGVQTCGLNTMNDYVLPRVDRLVEGWVRRNKRVVVYAASSHTRLLAEATTLCRANIVGVADSDTRVQGRSVLGHTVVAPEDVIGLRPDVVVISSGLFQEEIFEQLADLETHGVEVVRLYHTLADNHYEDAVRLMGDNRPREAWDEYRENLETSEDADQVRDAAVCLYLGLGRMNDALALFQRSDRIRRERMSPQLLREGAPYWILDGFWAVALGHVACIDYVLKLAALEGRDPQDTILYLPPHSMVGNRFLLEQCRPFLRVVERADDLPLPRDAVPGLSLNFYAPHLSKGGPVFMWERAADIYQRWHATGRGPLLRLSDEVREKGCAELERIGVPRGAWFVALHVRESGFHSQRRGLHSVLNASLADYLPAIAEVTRRGGWVVRMGDATMQPLPPMTQVVDYCHSPVRSDWMDIFLAAHCRFFVGTSSGPVYVAQRYGVPCVLTNWWSHAKRPWHPDDIFVPKLIRRTDSGEALTLRESLAEPFGYPDSVLYLRENCGVDVVDSDPDDTRLAVAEMCELLDRTIRYEPSDIASRDRAASIYRSVSEELYGSQAGFGASRLGRDFIRRHPKFLA